MIAYARGSELYRRITLDLGLLFGLLVFFGVGVDFLHSALTVGKRSDFAVGLIEDGGEMLAMSLLVWYSFRSAALGWARPPVFIFDLILSNAGARRLTALIMFRRH